MRLLVCKMLHFVNHLVANFVFLPFGLVVYTGYIRPLCEEKFLVAANDVVTHTKRFFKSNKC